MKKLSYLLSLLLLMSMTVFTSCKDDEGGTPEPDPVQERKELMAGTHTVQSVSINPGDAVDITGQTITLTFSESGAYTGNNVDPLPGDFPASGTANISASNVDAVTIGSTTLNITTISEDGMTFTYETQNDKGEDVTATVTTTTGD